MAGPKWTGGTFTHQDGSVKNAHISNTAGDEIDADKLQHLYAHPGATNFGKNATETPVASTETVFVAGKASTIRGFHATLTDTGTTTDIDFDCLINGVSALSAQVNFTNADGDRSVKDGSLSTTAVAVDDHVTLQCIITTSTGALGPYAWVIIEENATT